MAKKKQIVINNQELTPTVLAVKEDKKTVSMIGFLWISLIFVAFIAAALYMPQISKTVKQYLNYLPFVDFDIDDDVTPVIIPNNKSNQNSQKQTTETKEEETQTENNSVTDEQSYIETELIIDGKVLAINTNDYNSL